MNDPLPNALRIASASTPRLVQAEAADPTRLAVMLEAETMQRAGAITLTQAKAHIRVGKASPVAHLALQQTEAANRLAAALRELHSVCLLMDHPDQMKRPTEDEYQAALRGAELALGRH